MTWAAWLMTGAGLVAGWLLRAVLAARSRGASARIEAEWRRTLEGQLAQARRDFEAAELERMDLRQDRLSAARAIEALRAESDAQAQERDRALRRAEVAVLMAAALTRQSARGDDARRDVATLELERDGLAQRIARLEAERREAALEHQEAVSLLETQLGAVRALVERVEPLRRQLEDRETLVRLLASERDEATKALISQERAWIARVDALEQELARLRTAEGRFVAVTRERDERAVAAWKARIEIESLRSELKARDLRFWTLLDARRTAGILGDTPAA